MASCNVVLSFESLDKIEWGDHSNETSLATVLFFFPSLHRNEILTKKMVLKNSLATNRQLSIAVCF